MSLFVRHAYTNDTHHVKLSDTRINLRYPYSRITQWTEVLRTTIHSRDQTRTLPPIRWGGIFYEFCRNIGFNYHFPCFKQVLCRSLRHVARYDSTEWDSPNSKNSDGPSKREKLRKLRLVLYFERERKKERWCCFCYCAIGRMHHQSNIFKQRDIRIILKYNRLKRTFIFAFTN